MVPSARTVAGLQWLGIALSCVVILWPAWFAPPRGLLAMGAILSCGLAGTWRDWKLGLLRSKLPDLPAKLRSGPGRRTLRDSTRDLLFTALWIWAFWVLPPLH